MPRRSDTTNPDLLPVLRAAAYSLTPAERAAPILVGLSGGPDSLALLHLLRRWSAEEGATIRALVVDHSLRPESATEAAGVAALCAAWGIAATVRTVRAESIKGARGGVEEAARQERYRLLAEEARAIGALTVALGHQANDQAETLLLHLLRGAGLAGLTGMPVVRRSGGLLDRYAVPGAGGLPQRPAIWRPLLGVDRAAILAYCRAWELTPVHDPTNDDQQLRRNAVRQRLLPLADELFPGATATLARATAILADDEALLDALTAAAWGRCATADGALVLLDREPFRAEHVALQRRILRRAWGEVRGEQSPLGLASAPIEAAQAGIIGPGSGGRWPLPRGLVVVVERERAVIGPAATIAAELRGRMGVPIVEPGWSVPLDRAMLIPLAGGWSVCVSSAESAAGRSDAAQYSLPPPEPGATPRLRTWQPGDRVMLPGGGTQKLQDWFVDHHLPRYARQHLPLLAVGARIRWIAGLAAFADNGEVGAGDVLGLTLLYNGAVWRQPPGKR